MPNHDVDISVTRPEADVDAWSIAADGKGWFVTAYQLDGITGNCPSRPQMASGRSDDNVHATPRKELTWINTRTG